jgi:hypothetical protein
MLVASKHIATVNQQIGLIMGNRIEYAKASPDGYKAFGGVFVYIQKGSLPEGTNRSCISASFADEWLRLLHRYAFARPA